MGILSSINVICPQITNVKTHDTFNEIPLILVIDFVHRYKITQDNFYMILEK
jgi:hypothetical protein